MGWGTGKFSVSDPGDENHENIVPQIVASDPPPAPLRAPRAPLAELPQPQPQPQPPGITEGGIRLDTNIRFVASTDCYDYPSPRWIPSDIYSVKRWTSSQDLLCWRFYHDIKPALPRTYIEFVRRHYDLSYLALQWAQNFFTPESVAPRMTGVEAKKLGEENPLLVRWIDSVASVYGLCWLDVLHERRHLIAMAILGKVLEDRVFKDEFFGAPDEDKILLRAIDRELEMKEIDEMKRDYSKFLCDAFGRQKPRATIINEALLGGFPIPAQFSNDVDRLFTQLVELLRPLLPTNEKQFPPGLYYKMLDEILVSAGKLSIDMRCETDTVYHVAITPPRYKGLNPERMSPIVFGDQEKENITNFKNDQTNLISVWPGVFAYRRLSYREVSFRTICRALVFTSDIGERGYPRRIEGDPDRIFNLGQFWQYLRFLGVTIRDGRAW